MFVGLGWNHAREREAGFMIEEPVHNVELFCRGFEQEVREGTEGNLRGDQGVAICNRRLNPSGFPKPL